MCVIHETGHARYEQGLPKALSGMPSGEARSMGIHESQSLFFEMQLARNPVFVAHLVRFAKETFGRESDPAFAEANMDAIYKRVEPGYIRVDADEVTYPAHIILRYELERALIEGSIEVEDIPVIWNQKMQEYLNINTEGNYTNGCMQDIHWTDPKCQMSTAEPNYKDGFMQDIHWCDGSFGYFPSYTLGAMYAAQFMATIRKTIDVDECLHTLNFEPIWAWLEDNIWSKGSMLTTDELVIQATGEPLNPEYFKQHLIARYLNNS